MITLSKREQGLLSLFLQNKELSSSDVRDAMSVSGSSVSLVTIKRALSGLARGGLLRIVGSGRSVRYVITITGRVYAEVDAKRYFEIEPDKRYGMDSYNFDLFAHFPIHIFSTEELANMKQQTELYKKRVKSLTSGVQAKELERLIIELSWKSSKIEGNTYTLLDTEKLILENKVAAGKSKDETTMILNHKDAFNFVRAHIDVFKKINLANLEKLHSVLVHNLSVGLGLRKAPVGVLGSKYRPLDNVHQIRDAMDDLFKALARANTPYEKAMLILVGLSYIQPFEDGNKRTARMLANAVLLAHGCAPLSYRSVEEKDYREAMLVFYELNSITPFKKIFLEQYEFATKNYAVKL